MELNKSVIDEFQVFMNKYEEWIREVMPGGVDRNGATILYPLCESLRLETERVVKALFIIDTFWKKHYSLFIGHKATCLHNFLDLWYRQQCIMGFRRDQLEFKETIRMPLSLLMQLVNHFHLYEAVVKSFGEDDEKN